MKVRSAGDDTVPPPLRNPDAFDRALVAACMIDVVFRSRAAEFASANPGATASDYIYALTKPFRDAGTMPTFQNVAAHAAFVLALPPDLAQGW